MLRIFYSTCLTPSFHDPLQENVHPNMYAGQATEYWLPRFNRLDRSPYTFYYRDPPNVSSNPCTIAWSLHFMSCMFPFLCVKTRSSCIRVPFLENIHSGHLLRMHHIHQTLLRATTFIAQKQLAF